MIRNAFVHVPKTGGIRFQPEVELCERNEKNFHCTVDFYLEHDHDHRFFTMIRDPYDVAASTFYFLKKFEYYAGFNSKNPSDRFHARIANSSTATVEDFLYNWEENSLYSFYYCGKPAGVFDFIGLTERMNESSQLMYNMFGIQSNKGDFNRNEQKTLAEPYQTGYSRLTFMKDHEQEYQIYFEYLDRFHQLCKEYKVHNP
jgi:hypothetical protein